jgi:hypothetical protein
VRGKRRLAFSSGRALVRLRSNFTAPDTDLETSAGPSGAATAVCETDGGVVGVRAPGDAV